jgi:predicted outer membrane lipoprotein
VWFYLVSLALMAGAVINALRYELHDTGTMRMPADQAGDDPAA